MVKTAVLSVLPGLFWITYLRSLSGGKLGAWWHWLLALAAGVASARLSLSISAALGVSRLEQLPWLGSLIYFILGVGLVEEGSKALCAIFTLKPTGLGREPLRTLQLSGGVALGFATAENFLYASHFGDSAIVMRFLTATLGHILFGALWGFAMGAHTTQRQDSGKSEAVMRWGQFFGYLLLAALAHGLYDWFLFSGRTVMAVLLMAILWCGFREAVLGAFLQQEYRRRLPFELRECPECSVLTRAQGRYCSFCRLELKEDNLNGPDEPEPLER